MSKPLAVAISDIHFTLNTLETATKALEAAFATAKSLHIPLIIAGDLINDKAILRAEVVNRLISIFESNLKQVKSFLIVGNHDLQNEKAEANSLEFLSVYTNLVSQPTYDWETKIMMLPYYSNSQKLTEIVKDITPGTLTIMHQGFRGAWMGDYIQDKSSIDPKEVSHLRVFSGHYHKHQGVGSSVTYIGSPYTITFGEADDGPKGYLVINEDGSFERKILKLRKHVIIELDAENPDLPSLDLQSEDLIWVKVKGTKIQLAKFNKNPLGLDNIHYKITKIETEENKPVLKQDQAKDTEILDQLIDATSLDLEDKQLLKLKWRNLIDES